MVVLDVTVMRTNGVIAVIGAANGDDLIGRMFVAGWCVEDEVTIAM